MIPEDGMKSSRVGFAIASPRRCCCLSTAAASPRRSTRAASPNAAAATACTRPSRRAGCCWLAPTRAPRASPAISTRATPARRRITSRPLKPTCRPERPPLQRTPGGDFGWLKKNYSFTVRGTTTNEDGETHGHNIVAVGHRDSRPTRRTRWRRAARSFAASQLGCQSCHDPHGRARRLSDGSYVNAIYNAGSTNAPIIGSGSYNNSATPAAGQAVGVYRLLRGLGDSSQGVTFNGVAIAVAPSTYNQNEDANQVRVAYGDARQQHLGQLVRHLPPGHALERQFRAPGRLSRSGTDRHGQLQRVREVGRSDGHERDVLLVPRAVRREHRRHRDAPVPREQQQAPTSSARPRPTRSRACPATVRMPPASRRCSGSEHGRRVHGAKRPVSRAASPSARARTEAEMTGAYYDRPVTQFASYQRVLCNKCHAKD